MPRPVFVNALPKSGTNLVGDCLDLLGMLPKAHVGAQALRSPSWARLLKRLVFLPTRRSYLVGIDMPIEAPNWYIDRRLNGLAPDEYITAHVGYTADVLHEVVKRDIAPILVTRDPRAVVNSFVHYLDEAVRHPLYKAFQDQSLHSRYMLAMEGMFANEVTLQPIDVRCQAVRPWTQHRDVLHVRFEDLIGPEGGGAADVQRAAVKRIVDHVEAPTDKIDVVLDHLFGKNENTFRSGQIDAWRKEIPSAVRDDLDAQTQPIRDMWGYST